MNQPTPDLSEVLARLTRLEQANRRWKVATILVGILLGGVFLLGADSNPAPDVVVAKRFQLVDDKGKTRVLINLTEKYKEPAISFFDQKEKTRAEFVVTDSGALLTCNHKSGSRNLIQLESNDKGGLVVVRHPENKSSTMLGFTEEAEFPIIALTDAKGVQRSVWMITNPSSYFALRDEEGTARITLTADKKQPAIDLLSKSGKKIYLRLATEPGGGGVLKLWDADDRLIFQQPR